MNKTLQILFYKNAGWNTLDALGTQSLVVVHHILLQIYGGAELHGIIGTVFSLLYMSVLIANMGFDFSCAPFLFYYTADKAKWREYIRTKLAQQLRWICLCALIGCIVLMNFTLSEAISSKIILVLAALFINESIKKTLKMLLQLLFYTPYTALIEFGGMVLYMLGVWGWYYTGHGITLLSSFGILYSISLMQIVCLVYVLHHWYKHMPKHSHMERPTQLNARITRTRVWVSAQRIIEQLFSNNFLVPFFAVSCGLVYASYFKIISSVARWVSLFGDKTFGTTSLMLLAKDPSASHQVLPFINRLLFMTLACLLPLLLAVSMGIGYYCSVQSYILLLLCALLILLRCVDMGCVAYERWLLMSGRAWYSLFFSGITFACAAVYMTYAFATPLSLISILIIFRLAQLFAYFVLFNKIKTAL